ncbi:MAG: RNA polymerase sigma factor [Candidatus Hydrogenedentes bacterium]|nr:RNA polymerase sigma factor [Candidatus Hydrogenedentota bacterium]MBI3118378.1 RNA polymerase sigma factor [Candidatus Hydrogenedentota bacterium]
MAHAGVQTHEGAWADSAEAAPLSDLELVARTKDGDSEAFSELVLRHQQMIYNVAFRYMRESALAEDMAQEAFLKGFRLLQGFRGDCSFSTWMYRVTCSVCLTELNRRKRRGEVPIQAWHTEDAQVAPPEGLDLPDHLRRCIAKLSDRYATIVTLYYLKGVSYEEITQALGIPMGTLKTWMFRARKQLRRIVEKEMVAGERASS